MLANYNQRHRHRFEGRTRHIAVALIIALGVLVARLVQLQVVHGADYGALSTRNRMCVLRVEAPRGTIYGRNEQVILADNRPAWDVVVVPKECTAPEAVCVLLEDLIHVDAEQLLAKIQESADEPYKQVEVKRDISRTALNRIEEHAFLLPGIFTVVRPHRRYLHGPVAGQLLGYLGEIGPEELERRAPRYKMGDIVGIGGLEKLYEDELRGTDGQIWVNNRRPDSAPQMRTDAYGKPYVEVDSFGRTLEEEAEWSIDPQSGRAVHITIDVELQAFAERLLAGQVGAIAVLNAKTGEILTLASSPRYDPSIFIEGSRSDERRAVLSDKAAPMRNRCFQSHYPPGSVFKILVAIAALENGIVNENTSFFCNGFLKRPGYQKRCWRWRLGGHGDVSIVDALAYSCDVYFYSVGLMLGVDQIHDWAVRLGYGEASGLGMGEVIGVIPSREWKAELFASRDPWDRKWYPAETADLAIGQGYVTVTPLQAATVMAVVVNGGYQVHPYLDAACALDASKRVVSEKTIEIVRKGMQKCVEHTTFPRGTGIEAQIPGMVVLGKTGTAQVVSRDKYDHYENEEDIPYKLRDHAWFVAGVLDRDPPIAVSVLIEHGLHGSSSAAPLARQVIEFFYGQELESLLLAKGEEVSEDIGNQ